MQLQSPSHTLPSSLHSSFSLEFRFFNYKFPSLNFDQINIEFPFFNQQISSSSSTILQLFMTYANRFSFSLASTCDSFCYAMQCNQMRVEASGKMLIKIKYGSFHRKHSTNEYLECLLYTSVICLKFSDLSLKRKQIEQFYIDMHIPSLI